MLVEDEKSVRSLVRNILVARGYTVLEAATGDEAIRVTEAYSGPVHLLITDVVLPGMGGVAIAENVSLRRPGVRVLFISGYTDDAVVRNGVLHEHVSFLQKPFSPTTLATKVREVLDEATDPTAATKTPH